MKISVLTICPEQFESFQKTPVAARAQQKGLAEIEIVDIRNFAGGSYRHVDDSPFGGGAGAVLRCMPVIRALEHVRGTEDGSGGGTLFAALTPGGTPFTQAAAREMSGLDHLILLCGHYEGIDERAMERADRRISIGDYVLTGGELAAQVVMDAVLRLIPGNLRARSLEEESFDNGLLEYPQYTQPASCEAGDVPEVLLSGDHERIRRWRLRESLRATEKRRPDLLAAREMTAEEAELLREAGTEGEATVSGEKMTGEAGDE